MVSFPIKAEIETMEKKEPVQEEEYSKLGSQQDLRLNKRVSVKDEIKC